MPPGRLQRQKRCGTYYGRFAQRFWRLALQLLGPLVEGGGLDWQVVLQGGKKSKMTGSDWSVLWRALNSCRWTLWVARTVVLMESRTISPEQAWIIAKAMVRDYMRRDCRRYGKKKAQGVWGAEAWGTMGMY